jgi:hypothetical protein
MPKWHSPWADWRGSKLESPIVVRILRQGLARHGPSLLQLFLKRRHRCDQVRVVLQLLRPGRDAVVQRLIEDARVHLDDGLRGVGRQVGMDATNDFGLQEAADLAEDAILLQRVVRRQGAVGTVRLSASEQELEIQRDEVLDAGRLHRTERGDMGLCISKAHHPGQRDLCQVAVLVASANVRVGACLCSIGFCAIEGDAPANQTCSMVCPLTALLSGWSHRTTSKTFRFSLMARLRCHHIRSPQRHMKTAYAWKAFLTRGESSWLLKPKKACSFEVKMGRPRAPTVSNTAKQWTRKLEP